MINNKYLAKEFFGKGGHNSLNPNYQKILIKDCKILKFTNLYLNAIIELYENDFLGKTVNEGDIEKIKYFLKNKNNIPNFDPISNFANQYFFKLSINNKYLVSGYSYAIIKDIVDNNADIIYTDTDKIIYNNDINLLDINYKYTVEDVKYFYAFRVKTYILMNNKSEYKLHSTINNYWINRMNKIKNLIEMDKLNNIIKEILE